MSRAAASEVPVTPDPERDALHGALRRAGLVQGTAVGPWVAPDVTASHRALRTVYPGASFTPGPLRFLRAYGGGPDVETLTTWFAAQRPPAPWIDTVVTRGAPPTFITPRGRLSVGLALASIWQTDFAAVARGAGMVARTFPADLRRAVADTWEAASARAAREVLLAHGAPKSLDEALRCRADGRW